MAAFEELEKAACCLLQIIKDTPDLGRSTKVAIAGDMALRKYLPKYRPDNAAVVSNKPSFCHEAQPAVTDTILLRSPAQST